MSDQDSKFAMIVTRNRLDELLKEVMLLLKNALMLRAIKVKVDCGK
jgi:hypothetical protein